MKNKKIIGLIVALALMLTIGGVYAVDMTVDELKELLGMDGMLSGITNYDDLEVDSLTVAGDITATGDLTITDEITYGGVTGDWITGSCANATTTIFAVLNPFSADVSVDIFELNLVNGTSTIDLQVGTSSQAFSDVATELTDTLIDGLAIATSTEGTATTTERVFVRNSSSDIVGGGFSAPGTNSEPFIRWESGDYITGFATSTEGGVSGANDGILGDSNFFGCTFKIHSYR